MVRVKPRRGRLVGRNEELALLGEQIAITRDGRGTVTLVEGRPGFGKTRLLEEAVGIARRAGLRSATGTAIEGGEFVPMAPLLDVLEASGEGRPALAPQHRHWMVDELEQRFEHVSLEQPLLVCIDDLQWADGGTIVALGTLPRRLSHVPIAWLLACREGEGPSVLPRLFARLQEETDARPIVLNELPGSAVEELVADLLGAPPDRRLAAMAVRAQGSPFLAVELILGLLDENLVHVDGGQARLLEVRVPARVRASMRERLRGLSPTARQVATVMAVLGRQCRHDVLSAMLDTPPAALLPPVQELLEQDVLTSDGDELAFRHDLIRQAVVDALPRSTRRALQRDATNVLLRVGASPLEVAGHLAASAEPGDREAISLLADAARELRKSNPAAAADLARGAYELTLPGDPQRGTLAADVAVFLHAAGRVGEGRAFADAALRDLLPAADEAAVCLSLASMLTLSPDVRADMAERGLALQGVPGRLRAHLFAALCHNRLASGETDAAVAARSAAGPVVDQHGDATARLTFALSEIALGYVHGDLAPAIELLDDTMRRRHESADDARGRMTAQWRCELLMALDRTDEALETIGSALLAAKRDRQLWATRWFESSRGRYLFQLGRLTDARATLEGLLAAGEDVVGLSVVDLAGLVALGRLALHTGDVALGAQTERLARPFMDAPVPGLRRHAAWLLALRASSRRDAGAARSVLAELGDDAIETILPLYPRDVADAPQLVRIALEVDDVALARDTTETAEALARQNPGIATAAGAAAHCRGLLERDSAELVRAVSALTRSPRPLALASAVEDAGVGLVADGRKQIGVARLSQALETYAPLGAETDAQRVRGRLRALGVRRRLQRSHRPQTGWAGLTESELGVVELVSEGLTNRQVADRLYISPHTVGIHLRHAFAKLGVHSRVELTRLALERDHAARR
jgi:DNA-binding CsgD family transcriptional regulator